MNRQEAAAAAQEADQNVAAVWARQPRPTPNHADAAEVAARNAWNREAEAAQAAADAAWARVWEA
jgi:hypothetical protein